MVAVLVLSGCGQGDPAAGKLLIAGSSTVAPLLAEIAARFEAEHPGTEVDVQAGGSSRGIADVRRGLIDIGAASRALGPGEAGLTEHAIARDGIALIVHRSNPVTTLDAAQVRAIYTGRIDDWGALGLPAGPITVVNKADGRATLTLFLAHFDLDAPDVVPNVVVGHNMQGIQSVAGSPGAIGYVSIGAGEQEAARGQPIRLLPMNGISADSDALRDGRYPLSRPLNLITPGEPTGLARRFIDYAQSPAVHDLVRQLHFVPAGRP
ncbi:MAG: phosphate ABC transporter substrate-binding protein [Salinisphaeraceae bacterium]